MKKVEKFGFSAPPIIVLITLLFLVLAALFLSCDEGMDMVKPVVSEPAEKPVQPQEETPTVTMGEVKVPEEPEYTPSAEITYYRDRDLTVPATDSVEVGTTLYIQVTFSKEVPIVIADTEEARPSIFWTIRPHPENHHHRTTTAQYRIKPQGTELQSGDAMPYQGAFLCKYVVGTEDFGRNFLTHTEISEGDELEVIFFSGGEAWQGWGDKNTPTRENPNDFVGLVSALKRHPVADAAVTIMAGPRTGERVMTNHNGQYTFRDVAENELHLRVEKEYFEPKEVIVYLDRQTILANGDKPNFRRRSKEPGSIQIGQRWPDEIRPILENTLVVYDLLWYEDSITLQGIARGTYSDSSGVIRVNAGIINEYHTPDPAYSLLGTLAHEIMHAHQHALFSVDGSADDSPVLWETDTPEGRAFARAREKDWEEFGKVPVLDTISHNLWLNENAAEVAAYYWITYPRAEHNPQEGLETTAPHRFRWAEEWLGKKY